MIPKIKEKMISEKLSTRILWLTILFVVIFYGVTVFSYFVLPDGFLLKKNSVTNFKTSENLMICALQIFSYNMISIVVIIFGSLFARKKEGERGYKSYGCLGFFVFTILNAITLGTWSFTVNTNSVPLMERITRTFDIMHNAGLLEMVWKVFCEYEAVDYPEGGKEAFYQAIHSEEYLATLEVYGALCDEKIVGIMATRNKGTHVALFFVDGQYHRKGIGKKLWEAVLSNTSANLITVHSSLYAAEIYKKLGFYQTDSLKEDGGIQYIPMEYNVLQKTDLRCYL